ncbi:MAG TPA: hypothetical protein DEG74_05375 [Clostridiales bacterium]|nr:hypothetical protein [Clostridiales bacterium]
MKKHDRKNEDDRKAVKDITPKEENASSVDPDMPADPDAPSAPDESEITSPEETGYAPEDLSSAEISEVSEEALSADIVPSDDPDFEVAEADDMLSSSKDDKWIDAEPVPMELGAHEIHSMISDDDPDAPAFTEISTRPSDAKPNKSSKKMNIKPLMFLIVMAIVAVLVLIWSVISLGNLNERMTSPITVGNHDVSNAEFSFMYHYVLLENGVDIFKPDTEKMLQQPGENGFATYREYFLDVTAKEIQATYMLYDDATAHGFSITQDHKDRAQAYVDWLKTKADAIHVDLDTYIKGTFGPYVNKSLILSVLSKVYFTEDYSAHQKLDELKATPEQAEKAYQDARNSYDLVSYRVLRITFEQREESYVKTANLHAEQIIEKIAGDQSKFESTAAQYFSGEAQQRLLVPDSTLHKRVRYSEINESEWRSWLFDTSRASGDTVIFKDDYGFPIIFCFVERVRQDEPLRNVRFFYINLENPETETPGIPASEILPLSQTIFDSITDEASMITLETTYADQLMDGSMRAVQQTSLFPGNNTEEIDDWIFDPQRKSGDKILLEGDTQILILFYVEASPNPEWYDRVNSFIRMDNYQAFVSEKIANYSYTFHEDGLKYIKDIPS